MKLFFIKYQTKINILFSVIITACIFYSGTLGLRVSEIYTEVLIDGTTINNSFITLSIGAGLKNNELLQKTLTGLNEQMPKFNEKWGAAEREIKAKRVVQFWINLALYTLIALQIIFNVLVYGNIINIGPMS